MIPMLEGLESRLLLSAAIEYHGGKVIGHGQVDALFLGQAVFQQAHLNQVMQEVVGPLTDITAATLGVGVGSLRSSTALPGLNATTNAGVQWALQSAIANGWMPPPNADTVDMVFVAEKPTDANLVNDDAFHSLLYLPSGQAVPYTLCWPLPNGGEDPATAHEGIEAFSDPEFDGWHGVDLSKEVCDVLGGRTWTDNGITVATIAGPDGQPLPGQGDGRSPIPLPPPVPAPPPPPPVLIPPPVVSVPQSFDPWGGLFVRLELLFDDLLTYRLDPSLNNLDALFSSWSSWGI